MINFKKIFLTAFLLFLIVSGCEESEESKRNIFPEKDTINQKSEKEDTTLKDGKTYVVSKYFTPVLNTDNFSEVYGGKDGSTLKRSKNGLIKELEYVAYPGSVFEVITEYKKNGFSIFKVYTKEYDIPELEIELFVDSRFVDVKNYKPKERKVELPSKEKIYRYLDSSLGSLYVWGGNNIEGVPEMKMFYPPKSSLSDKESREWGLKGVDCSGLIYQATNGYTARNTHQMVNMGEGLKIEGLSAEKIAKIVKPLDIIVWKGHVIIVYDSLKTIESAKSAGGVVKKDLLKVLNSLIEKRKPANKWRDGENIFLIRRWYK